ncbi:acetyl-CoA carboxylase biotin carboxyl carrier protein subunit [Actinomadura graeca]|uniref:Biotin carboxyl carrier protein of acetyl-CoA carboxylase n=1 Tax=Actinomadura graeca TaxID=2750812 RepID=A0ABX8QRT2_9ACTN|nr:biotin/lipoyl-containing protein [Actinomadura graeca]QXJ21516.1 acetyl-CoA carboxylase biotin carboxyl carrier protein subunit [Actinomadura graeca]
MSEHNEPAGSVESAEHARPAAQPPPGHESLRLLREEVSHLVKTVPGPVTSVSARLGECVLEVTWAQHAPEAPRTVVAAPAAAVAGVPAAGEPAAPPVDDTLKRVVAPLVGTFYVAPEPGAPPFVQPGDRIEAGQTIGIVEAMKLMNPVASDWSGEVLQVMVADAEPVEFGQVLVRIRTDGP